MIIVGGYGSQNLTHNKTSISWQNRAQVTEFTWKKTKEHLILNSLQIIAVNLKLFIWIDIF